jgi:hypothetical protein
MKLGFILIADRYTVILFTLHFPTFQPLRLVPERPFAEPRMEKIIVLNCNCLGVIILHTEVMYLSILVMLTFGKRIDAVKHKTILQLFNTYIQYISVLTK